MPSAVARRREGYEHELEIRGHRLTADEPADDGGTDAGPRPTELLAASLASCTAITIEMYANRKGWELGAVEVAVDFTPGTPDTHPRFDVKIKTAEISDEQRERILVIASKCPVHRAIAADEVEITNELETLPG